MGIKAFVKGVLTEKQNRKYESLLAQRQCTYEQWLCDREKDWRAACGTATGCEDFYLVVLGEGQPVEDWQQRFGCFFENNPNVKVAYGDEDLRLEDGMLTDPWFKPDWSPDLLDCCRYFGSLVAVRKEHFEKIGAFYHRVDPKAWDELFGEDWQKQGQVLHLQDPARSHEWLRTCVSAGYTRGAESVGHLPQILFHSTVHAREHFLQTDAFFLSQQTDLMKHFFEEALLQTEEAPIVSVIIPSKDHSDILRQCLDGVRVAAEVPCQIIVVDNGSNPENRGKVEALLQQMEETPMGEVHFRCEYLYQPMEFHFSKMCNLGAQAAKAQYLLFLNDDVVLQEGCIPELAARAGRAYTGAVGLKLLYPEDGRIQHAGITNLPMGPVHKLQTLPDDSEYYDRRNRLVGNYLAVTAACLMIEKKKFLEIGGFEESLAVAFNDVDLCYRLYEAGYSNVCINDRYAYHHESLSRGADESIEKVERLLRERDILFARHPKLAGRDPYYAEHLNRDGLDVRIAPGYRTAKNRCEKVTEVLPGKLSAAYREDPCLLVRVEDLREKMIYGYSVVLGDDNSNYDFSLILRHAEKEESFVLPFERQFRPDLAENMPDQIRVELAGFWVDVSGLTLPAGKYSIGVLAKNQVSRLRLVNWSNRRIDF